MPSESNLEIKIIRKIKEITPSEWNRLFPDILEDYYFLKSLEDSKIDQFEFRYILVYDNEKLVGAAACFLMDYPLDIVVEGFTKKFLNIIKKISPKFVNPRTLLCGVPTGQGRLGIFGDVDRVISTICTGLEKIAKEEKASLIFFKDFDSTYAQSFDKMGFSKFSSLPNTIMDIHFKNFDEYLNTLSYASKNGLKRKLKKNNNIKFDLEILNELKEDTINRIYELYLETVSKHALNFEILPKDFFQNISKNMLQETRYFLWRLDNKIIAFALCLVKDSYFIDYYLGFDYSVAHQYHLYFIRFRDLLNWCIENKIKKYEMGVTGYEAKRRLGFKFINLYMYAKHQNKLISPIFKIIGRFIAPQNYEGL